MKHSKIFLIFILSSVMLTGCLNTNLVAPEDNKVRVLGANEAVKYRKESRNWYLLYGAVPLYTVQPEELIAEQKLTEVRVQTEDTVMDGIISFFTSAITILPQTVVVEGN